MRTSIRSGAKRERRKAIAKSIRVISVEELKALGGNLFRYADDPWRETFFAGSGALDYTLFVPRTARIARLDLDDGKVSIEGMQNTDVKANVVDGRLAIRNCCGNIKAGVVNGVRDLVYGRCATPQHSADVQVLNGNVRLSVVRGASFRVRGETLKGKITNQLGETVQLGQPSRKIDISVGAGARSDITMRVTSGDITVVAADSE